MGVACRGASVKTRKTASSIFKSVILLFFVAILLSISPSESLLGKIAFGLGLAGMVINLIAALWVWLAVHWVDRNGQWE